MPECGAKMTPVPVRQHRYRGIVPLTYSVPLSSPNEERVGVRSRIIFFASLAQCC